MLNKSKKEISIDIMNFSKLIKNNFSILFVSSFKNLRTYLYIFILPLVFLTALILYQNQSGSGIITLGRFAGFVQIPAFMIIFLVNITISEWKNSVFLKRIHSAGVSKINFLFSLLLFNFVVGIFAVLTGMAYIFFIDAIYVKQIVDKIGILGFTEWFGIFYGAFFSVIISIAVGTIISGLLNSVALSQAITTIFIVIAFVFSDCFLSPETIATLKILISLSYIIPYKHSVWASFLMVAGGVVNYIFPSGGNARLTYSFNLITWIPIFTSIVYTSFLLTCGYFSFKWNNK